MGKTLKSIEEWWLKCVDESIDGWTDQRSREHICQSYWKTKKNTKF